MAHTLRDASARAVAAGHHLDAALHRQPARRHLERFCLGFLILYPELVRSGQTLASLKGNLIPTFIVIAAIFIIINYLLTRLARYLERRLQAAKRGPKVSEFEELVSPSMAPWRHAMKAPGQIYSSFGGLDSRTTVTLIWPG